MGIATASLGIVIALILCALLAYGVEKFILNQAPESGPAGRENPDIPSSDHRDPGLYVVGPVVALLAVAWGFVVIPFSPHLIGSDLGIGVFYYLVVIDFVVLAIALSGWGANTPQSVEASYRAIAQMIAYVTPLGLAVIGPIMMARSLRTIDIVEAQATYGLWYIILQPLGFVLYLATGLMQAYRAPFLEPFSSGIRSGVLGVYTGAQRLLWKIALAGLLFLVASMGAVLFLGGYSGPLLPAPVWMLIKTVLLLVFIVWGGKRFQLMSVAGTLRLSWRILIPAGLLNVLVVGGLILLGVGQKK